MTTGGEREVPASSAPADIRLDEVTKRFEDVVAVDKLSLEIERGSFFALLGPSGCGKTTTLRMIGGFEQPTEGAIYLADEEVSGLPAYKRDVNTVFQSYALFPHLSVFENIAFGLRRRSVRGDTLTGRVAEILRIVGLAGMEKRKPRQLSGGQQQRVALARALVNKPQVLLLDEPLGALDLKLRRQMQDELKLLQKRVGTTFVHVTHDQEEAMALADLLVVMNHGRIEDIGPPERVYAKPASLFTAGFMGEVTTFDGTVLDTVAGETVIDTVLGMQVIPGPVIAPPGGRVTIAIRPECLVPAKSATAQQASASLGAMRVREVVFQGPHRRLLGEIGPVSAPIEAVVRVAASFAVGAGDTLPLSATADDLLVYPAHLNA